MAVKERAEGAEFPKAEGTLKVAFATRWELNITPQSHGEIIYAGIGQSLTGESWCQENRLEASERTQPQGQDFTGRISDRAGSCALMT